MFLVSDIGVDSHSNPSFVSVHLCHTKTDISAAGTTGYLGWVERPVCPVKAILAYLALWGPFPGPLFIFEKKSPLSRLNLVRVVRSALESQDLDKHYFNGHRFGIGAATTAVARGIDHLLIQGLGHWKLSAFTVYIQAPTDSLISVSSILLSSTQH